MRSNVKRSVAAVMTATVMMGAVIAPAAQAEPTNDTANTVNSKVFSTQEVETLMNDPRVDQEAVKDLANNPTATPSDFASLFADWGIFFNEFLTRFMEFIQKIREFFGINTTDPEYDTDVVAPGEIPGPSSKAAFQLLCGADDTEVILNYYAEVKRDGYHAVSVADRNLYQEWHLINEVSYKKGDILQGTARITNKSERPYARVNFPNSKGQTDLRTIEIDPSTCLNAGS